MPLDLKTRINYSSKAQDRFEEMMKSALRSQDGMDKDRDGAKLLSRAISSEFGLSTGKELIYSRADKDLETDGHLNFGKLNFGGKDPSRRELKKNRKLVRQEVARRIDLAFGNNLANVRSWTSIFNPTLGQYLVDQAAPQGWFSVTKIDDEAMEKIAKAVYAMREEMNIELKAFNPKVSIKTDKGGTNNFTFTKSKAKEIFNRAQNRKFTVQDDDIGSDTRIGRLSSADKNNHDRQSVAATKPTVATTTNVGPIVDLLGVPLDTDGLNEFSGMQPPDQEAESANGQASLSAIYNDDELDAITKAVLPNAADQNDAEKRSAKKLYVQAVQLCTGTEPTASDYDQAFDLFQEVQNKTNDPVLRASAQFHQAVMHCHGLGNVSQDTVWANRLFIVCDKTDGLDAALRAASRYYRGIIAYRGLGNTKHDYKEARELFESSIKDSANEQQNLSAQKFLGEISFYGKGSAKTDYDRAKELFEIVANKTENPKDRASAQSYLGMIEYHGYGDTNPNLKNAHDLFVQADTDNADPETRARVKCYLGLIEYHGYGDTNPNLENAHDLFVQADTDNADPETRARVKCYLGLHHFYGSGGVEQDFKKAFELLADANTKNADPHTRAKAAYHLNKFAEVGIVTPESDFDTAREQLNTDEIAPNIRELEEKYFLAEILLSDMSTNKPDPDRAKEILEGLVKADGVSPTIKSYANYQLGVIAYHGYGTTDIDHLRALNYFNKAAEEGVVEEVRIMAQYYLGRIYCYGATDVQRDPTLALKHLSATSKSNPDEAKRAVASLDLGLLYFHRDGMGLVNYDEALKHFKNANVDGAVNHTRANALLHLGDLYFYGRGKLGVRDMSMNYSDARYMFNQALLLSEGLPEVQASAKYHLACVAEKGLGASIKNPIKARDLFAEVVAMRDAPQNYVAEAQKHIQLLDRQIADQQNAQSV